MTRDEAINRLQNETKENPVLSAVFHVLALRERPRYNLTPDGLYYRMRREGFKYSKRDYTVVFELLQGLGLARLMKDKKGEVEQVKDFRLPLPKLGALACGENVDISTMGKLLTAGGKPAVEPFTMKRAVQEGANVMVTQELQAKRTPRRRFIVTKAASDGEGAQTVATREPRAPRPWQTSGSRLILTVLVNDKPINIPVPKDLTSMELASFISELMGEPK